MGDLTCGEVADSAPGFALDILDPAVRARVAVHLLRCPQCRRRVSCMQASAAELLDLTGAGRPEDAGPSGGDGLSGWGAPGDDEPAGAPPGLPAGRRRLRTVVSVATAAALLVGTSLGPEIGLGGGHGPTIADSGVLLAGGQPVGTVEILAGHPAVVEVRAGHLTSSGTVGVVITYRDGSARRIGQTELHHGRAVWAGVPPAAAPPIGGVVLVDGSRHQVAAAVMG